MSPVWPFMSTLADEQITPVKGKGSMGPPNTPHTPFTSGSTVRSLIVTPSSDRSLSSSDRARSETPFTLKAEPMDPPSPSPRRFREPSALPPMSPRSQELVVYRPSARASSTSPSMANTMRSLRDMSRSSVAPFSRASSSRAPSSARSYSRSSSLAPSDSGSRVAYRTATEDFDHRPRQRRRATGGERDASSPAPPAPVPSLPPLPVTIIESSTIILDVLGTLYIQDVDAEEDTGEKNKIEFKQHCLDIISEQLFGGSEVSRDISKELAEEDIVCPPETIALFLSILKRGVADILKSAIGDFTIDGSNLKVKGKSARHTAWYAKYRSAVPGRAQLLADLTKTDATTIVSVLGQGWTAHLITFHERLSKESVNAKKGQCRSIIESVRRLCDLMVADIWP